MKKNVLTLFLLLMLSLSLLVSCETPKTGDGAPETGDGAPETGDDAPADDDGDGHTPIVPSDDVLMGTPAVDGVLDKMYEYSYRLTVSGE